MIEENAQGSAGELAGRSNRRPFSLGLGGLAFSLTLATLGCAAAPATEEDVGTSSAELHAGGDPRLAHYEDTYFRWRFGGKTLPTDAHGNAVEKNIVMLPVPPTPGDGTPGTLDVTLSAGEGFVLSLFGILGTSYRDGTPPDQFEPLSIYTTLEINFSVDGKTVISPSNVLRYYTKFNFDPVIPYDDPVVQAIIWWQGVGALQAPLCPGKHVVKLDVKNVEPSFGLLYEYHNTWNVTVKAGP